MDNIHRGDICRNDSIKGNQFVIAQNVRQSSNTFGYEPQEDE